MSKLGRSTLFSDSMIRGSLSNSQFYMSRASKGGTIGRANFAGSRQQPGGMSANYMLSIQNRTTALNNLQTSRIVTAEEIQGAKPGADLKKLCSELFSMTSKNRSPQNDTEFEKRAREADESELETSVGQSSISSASSKNIEKQVESEKLMACISNCGYEFDNMQTFLANKNALLRSVGENPKSSLDDHDMPEEEEDA